MPRLTVSLARASFGATFVLASAALGGTLLGSARRVEAQDVQRGPAARRVVHGVVTDSASRAPLAGADVVVLETSQSAITNAAGGYEIAGLLPAAVTVIVRHVGYAPVTRRVSLARGSGEVTVALAPRVAELAGVRVTADSTASFLATQQPSTTLSAAEVERRRGQTLGETIRDLPGVSIIQYGPSIAKPVVRGLSSQRVATINGGVPQEGQQWGAEHAPEIDAFAANEIQVIRGPGTVLYGSGALGGVVRVLPRPLPTSGGVGGELSTNGFLNNRQGAGSLLLEGAGLPLPFVGPAGWRTQVSARRAGDARTPGYYLPNTGFKELDYSAAVGVDRDWGRSSVTYSHFGTDLGLYLGAHVGNLDDLARAMESAATSPTFAYDIGRPDQKVTHDLVAFQTALRLPHDAGVEVSYGFQHNNRREYDSRGFAATGSRPAFALELYTHTLDVKYHHAPLGPLAGTIGVSGMRQGNLSPGRSFLIPQYRLYAGGVYALEEAAFGPLTLTAGGRVDARQQHAYQYGAPVAISPDDRRSYVGPSGSLGASYQLLDRWSLAGTLATAWRPPNVNERFSQGVHHGTAQYEIGDSTLVPERSLNADLTLRHQGARSRLEVSAYRNRINDYIYLSPRAPVITVRGAYPAYSYAHTDALLRGFEVTGELTPAPWLMLYANGNVVRGTDRSTSAPLYDMPADRLTASARLFGPSGAVATAPYFEIGTTQVRRQTRVPPVTVYRLPTAGYGLLNLELGAAALRVGGARLTPSITVRNALDRRYRDYLSRYRLFVNEPGRDVVVRLTVPFGAAR